jgi:hypothetical protein
MKKNKTTSNKKRAPQIVFDTKEKFYVMCGSDNGYEHEYTIVTYQSDLGTHYTMEYSNSSCWSYELQGVVMLHLLNTGNGYEWIDTDPMSEKIEYDEFFMYTTFMRLIQQLEGRYMSEIMKVIKIDSFPY